MKIVFVVGFEETYWDKVKYLTDGCEVVHICPPKQIYDDWALSQQLFRRKQEDILLEMILSKKLGDGDIVLVVEHKLFDFKRWKGLSPVKFIALAQRPNWKSAQPKLKYKTYKYSPFGANKRREFPIISLPEPNYQLKRDRIGVFFDKEHDEVGFSFITDIMERFPQYEFVFLYPYLNDRQKLLEEFASCKVIVHTSLTPGESTIDHYIDALGCGCCLMLPSQPIFTRWFNFTWCYEAVFVGGKQRGKTKSQKFWNKRLNSIKLIEKLYGLVDFYVRGYNFRMYQTRQFYEKVKTSRYLSGEEFINKLICL